MWSYISNVTDQSEVMSAVFGCAFPIMGLNEGSTELYTKKVVELYCFNSFNVESDGEGLGSLKLCSE